MDTTLVTERNASLESEYVIAAVIPVDASESDLLQRAASLYYFADFSAAEALVREAKRRDLPPLPADKLETTPGKGARAIIYGMHVRIGNIHLLVEERIAVPVSFAEKITALAREGKIIIVVLSGRSLSGAIVLTEEPRPFHAISHKRKSFVASPLRTFLDFFRKRRE